MSWLESLIDESWAGFIGSSLEALRRAPVRPQWQSTTSEGRAGPAGISLKCTRCGHPGRLELDSPWYCDVCGGDLCEKALDLVRDNTADSTDPSIELIVAVFAILGGIAMSDPRPDPAFEGREELAAMRALALAGFGLSPQFTDVLERVYRLGGRRSGEIEQYASHFSVRCPDPRALGGLIRVLHGFAIADGAIQPEEEAAIGRVATALDVTPVAAARLRDAASARSNEAVLFVGTFALLAKVAKADGVVSRRELDAVEGVIRDQFGASLRSEAIRVFTQAKDSEDHFVRYAAQIQKTYTGRKEALGALIAALESVALADGPMHPAEALVVRDARLFLGLESPADSVSDPYLLLGASRSDTLDSIKAGCRRLAGWYHPDKLKASEFTPFAAECGTQRFDRLMKAMKDVEG